MMYRTVSSWKEIYADLLQNMPFLAIIQGCAGCGKSTLLKELWKRDPAHTLCLAPTGIAAQNIRQSGCPATTIHSALRLKPVDLHFFHETDYEERVHLLEAVNLIIIDEMSFIDISLMEWLMSLIQASADDGHIIRLVLLGDVCQLPPVFKVSPELEDIRKQLFGHNRFFFNCPIFERFDPRVYVMEKIYRQVDERFSNALLSLRRTPVSQQSLKFLNTRVCSREAFAESCSGPFLIVVGTNWEKDEINRAEQKKLEQSGADYRAFETICDGFPAGLDFGRIPDEIIVHEGEQVMCTCNCGDYQNGTMGIVRGFSDAGLPIVRTSSGSTFEVQMHILTGIVPHVTRRGTIEYVEEGSMTLLGCQSAYAATVHKVQGLTLDKLYLQLGRWMPEAGVYVALSRCRRLEDIGISRLITGKDVRCSREAMTFFTRFAKDVA